MRGRGMGIERIGRVGATAGAALTLAVVLLALLGCSGGLFPEPVSSAYGPQACGSSGPRYAPYFTATPTYGDAPLGVAFRSDGADVTEWRWSFGDGATSSLPAPTHTYALAGTYTVQLTVVRPLGDGSDGTKTERYQRKHYIHVTGKPDLAIGGLSHTPDAASPGTDVTFTVTVRNDGTAPAAPSFVKVSGANTHAFARVPRLTPGATATVAAVLRMTLSSETFTIKADATSCVRESNEHNNTATHLVSSAP